MGHGDETRTTKSFRGCARKEDELRALEGLTVVRMEHKDIEMIAHAMGEIVRLKMKERGII
jgi:hypothetical protein